MVFGLPQNDSFVDFAKIWSRFLWLETLKFAATLLPLESVSKINLRTKPERISKRMWKKKTSRRTGHLKTF